VLYVEGTYDPATHVASNNGSVFADLHVFGRVPSVEGVPRCGCGGPPWPFDMDVDVAASVSPGVYAFPIWATDAQGNRADGTASIEIVAK